MGGGGVPLLWNHDGIPSVYMSSNVSPCGGDDFLFFSRLSNSLGWGKGPTNPGDFFFSLVRELVGKSESKNHYNPPFDLSEKS